MQKNPYIEKESVYYYSLYQKNKKVNKRKERVYYYPSRHVAE